MERLGWLESVWSILSLESLWDCCCSVVQSCLTLWDTMDWSTPHFPVLHYLLKFALSHIHWVHDAIQPSHPLLPPSPAFNLSQHHSLFQWVGSSHQVTKVLELQLQHLSFLWTLRVDFLSLTCLVSLLSKRLSKVFSNATVQRHQFFGVQPSWSNSHIQGEISITSDMQITPPLWQKVNKN